MTEIKLKVLGKLYPLCPEDGCVIIDSKYYDILKDKPIRWDQYGYARISIKNAVNDWSNMSLHQYILLILEGLTVGDNYIIHHKNALRFDNRTQNLDIVSYSLNNASADRKSESTTSIYKGITKTGHTFQAYIRNSGKKYIWEVLQVK